jgi:hypothetical protein
MSRSWYPVGKLLYNGIEYLFYYTKGAKASENFKPFGVMSRLEDVYFSTELFPLFGNRIIQKTRPEYKELLEWLDISDSQAEPLVLLEKTGGKRETDSLALFAEPQRSVNGMYEISFFVNGINHLPQQSLSRIDTLKFGEKLFLMKDVQNKFDALSILLRTDVPATIVGFSPRFLNEDFSWLLNHIPHGQILTTVKKVNLDAPIQLKLLCELKAPWPENFQPCSSQFFHPITDNVDSIIQHSYRN